MSISGSGGDGSGDEVRREGGEAPSPEAHRAVGVISIF
eukprot:CAMPEP_0198683724 /NCGR_PEP_ID=MMETSP1468-20131203/11088_1 /TAXON_ID=1461545 /ORGANISM="Mantoniella sp, Strain CCMP1436" /LENGTH=37 /DNA_ID= /DNA_START= /DNA_END= /DNA_ORIENTATION=